MTTEVDVCNRALDHLGANTITSLDDNTQAARVMKRTFDTARDSVLRDRIWRFAMARAELAKDATNPAFGYSYRYAMPAGFLRLHQIENSPVAEYALEGQYILSDYGPPLKITYVQRVESVGDWDAEFIEVMAMKLAMDACMGITRDRGLMQDMAQMYQERIGRASSVSSQEHSVIEFDTDIWLREHRGSGF